MLMDTILQGIGKTPIVRLNHVGKELPCELYVKGEFLNSGGSSGSAGGHAASRQAAQSWPAFCRDFT